MFLLIKRNKRREIIKKDVEKEKEIKESQTLKEKTEESPEDVFN
jgi:hypothetical protein